MTNSPLRWAGSKRSLLPQIRQALPTKIAHYIEPFFGSGCVFFDVAPPSAEISDFNTDLVQFFVALRDDPESVWTDFDVLDAEGADYYRLREQQTEGLTAGATAARFLYLNRFAFNGVYRTNRQGMFNVPMGRRTGQLPSRESLLLVAEQLKSVKIHRRDFLETTGTAKEGDFVYLDPPYRNATRTTYGEYGYGSFGTESDVHRLATELKRLNNIGARVMLSFNDDDELGDALDGWTVQRIERRRTVAARSSARTNMQGEILAVNYIVGGHND